ncbi:SHOCT domain-containing protein [Nocardia rhizosphaerihabitans]|uniref:SHOCT domain-containing protein n=1 Tax=Nocardia rhizosphaerihabitans TaxID=1691570 RepID=UPI001E6202D2|nr:SHOCT domain-containing protein [Nocardia rhizosphaerihabitans]
MGFSVRKATRDDKKRLKATALQQVLSVQGSGTTLAEVAINHGTAQKIEDWFHAHQDFGSGMSSQAPAATPQTMQPTATSSIADELLKLAQLRDAGVLTPAEFEAQKSKLLS